MFNLVPWKKKANVKVRHDDLTNSNYDDVSYPMARLRHELDRIWDRFWDDWPQLASWNTSNPMSLGFDVNDREDEYVLHADLPGFDHDDIEVKISGNLLTVRAEHKEQSDDKNGSRYRYGEFTESFTLPQHVEGDRVDARYHNGVLELHLPKKEDCRARRIPVHSAN